MRKTCKLARVTIWNAQIGRDIMFLFADRAKMNAYRRTSHRGKSIGTYMRSLIIDDILSGGGNVSTEYYPGSFRAIGLKYKVSGVTVSKCIEDLRPFRQTGENLPLHAAVRGQPKG